MVTRRALLRATGGLAGLCFTGMGSRLASADPIQSIQQLIDDYYRRSLNEHGANVGVIVGIVTPDNAARNGQIISAGRDTLTNPFGKRLELNERTMTSATTPPALVTTVVVETAYADSTLSTMAMGMIQMIRNAVVTRSSVSG